jgi:hypothetical protein
MSLLISIPFGRSITFAIERCKNVIEYIPESIIIVNFSSTDNLNEFRTTFNKEINKSIYINTIPRIEVNNTAMHKMFCKNLLHVHITNYIFAVQNNINFTHIMFLSDMDMFFRKGIYNFIKVYDAGFLQGNSFIKPLSLKMNEFAPGEFIYQRHDSFWTKSVYENPDFHIISVEQIEGQFYRKELFEKMMEYIEKLPVHYSKAITNMEEGLFSNVYMNIYHNKYPIFLPISVILRDDSILETEERLINIYLGNDIRKNMVSSKSYDTYHSFSFGIKRIDYVKKENIIVNKIIDISKRYIDVLFHNIRTKYVYIKNT